MKPELEKVAEALLRAKATGAPRKDGGLDVRWLHVVNCIVSQFAKEKDFDPSEFYKKAGAEL